MKAKKRAGLLEVFEGGDGKTITLTCRRVYYLCAFVGTVDASRVTVRYRSTGTLLETEAYLRYLRSFSTERITTEDIAGVIQRDLRAVLGTEVEVSVCFLPVGGIKVEVT